MLGGTIQAVSRGEKNEQKAQKDFDNIHEMIASCDIDATIDL